MQELNHSYSDDVFGQCIVILGPKIPPYGGISVHIDRVVEKLKKQNNKVYLFDSTQVFISYHRYLLKIVWFLIKKNPSFVYYHTPYGNDYKELYCLFLLKKLLGFKMIIVDHDCRYLFKRDSFFRFVYNILLKSADRIIFIGDITYQSYLNNTMYIPSSFSIESSYLPPFTEQKEQKWLEYPKTLHDFIDNHSPVLAMCVFNFSLLGDKDLYGTDLAIDAITMLQKDYPKTGLVCVVGGNDSGGRYIQLQREIKERGLTQCVYFLHGDYELWPLLFHTNLFIRPSRSDSYGISVAEAVACGIPAIVSDVCTRPKGCLLFPSENVNILVQKSIEVLQQQ